MFSSKSSFFTQLPTESEHPLHFTAFMLDRIRVKKTDEGTLKDFMCREPDYDIAFCSAWHVAFNQIDDQPADTAELLFQLLDNIHTKALSHQPEARELMIGKQKAYMPIQGRGYRNYYGLNQGWNSDAQGVQELAERILSSEHPAMNALEIRLENTENRIHVTNKGIHLPPSCKTYLTQETITKQAILDIIAGEYNKGCFRDNYDRLIVVSTASVSEKAQWERTLFSNYLTAIKNADTDAVKIEHIIQLVQGLEQLHIYNDGNARSLYILANYLMAKNKLHLFYPDTMCIFDGYSKQALYEKIIEGQERFSANFVSHVHLSEKFVEYSASIRALQQHLDEMSATGVNTKKLNTSFCERDFNLMLRQAAVAPWTLKVLRFLLEHANLLHINIHSQGKTSGTAMDVAKRYKNTDGVSPGLPHV